MNSDLVQIAAWRKSSRSNGSGQACVEVGAGDDVIGVRDTKDRAGGTLVTSRSSWNAFIADVKAGQFDR